MLKVDGAFSPVSTRRGTGFCITGISPPERFVAGQLSGGLKILYKHLREKKKSPHKKHGSQTDAEGKFQPCYPEFGILLVPLLAGRYKFVQIIGQGQSSILVAAEDTFHTGKKPVAVKIMHLDYSRLGAQEADCIQQLNKSDSLNVSRTVQLFNVFSFEGHYCLVFELLRPRPLHQYFQRCQFDNEEAKLKVIRKITLQLLQVLGFLKRENVIHADLKPENILFEEGEEIKIKVVDFGNAIHWVHREVSLYYDEFELQTLLYRAPEVMFGVPFGPEIDMWSLGCILAELYTGNPLFLGRNKNEILREITSVFGSIPKNPFQTGKFFQDLSDFVGHNPDINQLVLVTNMMRILDNSRNYAFASFLVGLLQYNPSKRLTPSQAALHPFLASEFPCAFLLPQQGDTISDYVAGYTDVLLTPEQYTFKPHIDEEIKRQHYSNTELLRRGTKTMHFSRNEISSSSLQTKQNKGDAPKGCSPEPNRNSENLQSSNEVIAVNDNGDGDDCEKRNKTGLIPVKNSSYAIEGPLAASQPKQTLPQKKRSPLHKEKMCSDDKEKRERKTSASLRPGLPTHKKPVFEKQNKNKILKLGSTERSDLVQASQKKIRIPRSSSYNEPEKPSMELKSPHTNTSRLEDIVSPGASSICEDKDKNKCLKLDRTERSDLVQISQKRTRIPSTCNEPEKSSMKLKRPHSNTSRLEGIVSPGASSICENKNKNKLLKLDSPVSEKKSRLPSSYNETERTSMKLKSPRADTSQRDSNVTEDPGFAYNIEGQHLKSEDSVKRTSRWNSDGASTNVARKDDSFHHSSTPAETRLDLETCSSCDAARTRVYYRKTKQRKTEQQNNLSAEVKCNVVEDFIAIRGDKKAANSVCLGHSPNGKTSIVDQRHATKRRKKKLCQESLEQDSENAGSPDKCQEDAVMLL